MMMKAKQIDGDFVTEYTGKYLVLHNLYQAVKNLIEIYADGTSFVSSEQYENDVKQVIKEIKEASKKVKKFFYSDKFLKG